MTRREMPRTSDIQVVVDASPEQLYAVVSDVTRIGEWSHECNEAVWLDGVAAPAVGARFHGGNKSSRIKWSRKCTITELVAGERFVYETSGGVFGDSTRWTFDFTAVAGGTRVRQAYQTLSLPRPLELFVLAFIPGHRDRTSALRDDLLRLGEVATLSR